VVRIGLSETHENDGENLQVVADKASGKVVLLFTQAHYRGKAWVTAGAGFGSRSEPLQGEILVKDGTHPVIYVAPRGHGITSATDPCVQGKEGILELRPAREGESVAEPDHGATGPLPYQLASTMAAFWPGVADGSLLGEGGLFDGTVSYAGFPVPRYYEADRFSGPWGPDRGIAPFAVDFSFCAGRIGALFFDPARRYAGCLKVPSPWSTEYVVPPGGISAIAFDNR
jgi:hypothetical protein